VTDNHLIGMIDSVQRVDDELRNRYPEDTAQVAAKISEKK
jgi:hypothetical protein